MAFGRRRSPAGHRFGAAVAAGLLGTATLPVCASEAMPPEGERHAVVTAVAGIVSFTRWPAEGATLRLCTLGEGAGVAALRRSTDIGPAQRPVTVLALTDAGQAAATCQALYVGTVGHAGTAATRELLRRLSGQPVLLLGEGAAFCSDGGMFCLEPGGAQVRFNANLDAIARSGLRVNPLVLRVARGASAGGS